MASFPYFRMWVSNWLHDTMHLTAEENGAYIRLIVWSWKRGPLPLDPARRALIIGASEEDENRLWRVLAEFWEESDEGFTNPRLERERAYAAEAAELREQRAEAGSKGGSKAQANRRANGEQTSTYLQPEPKEETSSGDEGSEDEQSPTRETAPLSHLLADLMVENGCRRPTVTEKWAAEERRLLTTDKRDPGEAERVLRWSQADEFWKTNILSMPKFRKQYDRLRMKALGEQPPEVDDGFGEAA